jgi:DME family drug/metabolite transporter
MYGEIFAILTNVSFALSFVLARKIEKEVTPIFQNAIRATIGFITFFIICLSFGIFLKVFSLPALLVLILTMSILFTVILGDTAYLHSQKILGPAKALAITTTSPFFTILFATVFLNRQLSINMIFSALLIGIGVIFITIKEKNKATDENPPFPRKLNGENENMLKKSTFSITLKGALWALFTAVSWAIGIALSDYSVSQVNQILNLGILSTMVAMMIRFLFASMILSSIAIIKVKPNTFPVNRNTWKILIISAILSYSIGSIFFGEAVHTAGASFMSLISTSLPLFTLPFSYLINKEKLSMKGFLGVIITIGGVLLLFV